MDEDSDIQLDQLLILILGEQLNLLQKGSSAIPTIIQTIIQSTNEDSVKWGGSPLGKRANKERNFELAYDRIMKDFFQQNNQPIMSKISKDVSAYHVMCWIQSTIEY